MSAWRSTGAGQWYLGLSERDRLAVLVLAGFVGLLMLWALVIAPIRDWRAQAEQRWLGNLDLLADVQAAQPALRRSAGTGGQAGPSGSQLMTMVANSSRAHGLTLARFQPESGGGVSVSLQGQAFDALVRWLGQLAGDGVSVAQLTVDAGEASGRVDARVVLRP